MPLLAGPVALSPGGGYMGLQRCASWPLASVRPLPGESEDGVAVIRRVERRFNDAGLISKKRFEFEVEVFLSSNPGAELSLRFIERMPISEPDQSRCRWTRPPPRGFHPINRVS